jgi:tetratricopeptide (TPR) repeat protein
MDAETEAADAALCAPACASQTPSVIAYVEEMARTSADEGEFDEALTYYAQLIAADPQNADWFASRAEILLTLLRPHEGLRDAERVIELQPQRSLGYRLQAEAFEVLAEPERATEALQRVLVLEPADTMVRRRIEWLRTQRHEDARSPASTRNEETAGAPAGSPQLTCASERLDERTVAAFRQLLRVQSEYQSARSVLARRQPISCAFDSISDTADPAAAHFDLRSFVGHVEAEHEVRRFLEQLSGADQRRMLARLVSEWAAEPAAHGLDLSVVERARDALTDSLERICSRR